MKAATIQQPVASFIVSGRQKFLSVAVSDPYRGRIAIHAGMKLHPALHKFIENEPYRSLLRELGVEHPSELPRGRILAVGTLVACTPAQYLWQRISDYQFRLCRLQPGRSAWVFQDIQQLADPVSHKGRPDVFDVDPRAAGEVTRQLKAKK